MNVYQDINLTGDAAVSGTVSAGILDGQALGPNATAIVKGILDAAYPVGTVVIQTSNATVATSPAAVIGGEWALLTNRFLLGGGGTYAVGSSGGSANAVVVSHTHALNKAANTGTGGIMDDGRTIQRGYSGGTSGVTNWSDLYSLASTGESGTGKNMPPYLVVYMWERIA